MSGTAKVNIEYYFNNREDAPLVDVRSPAEYAHAHIPGAVNIPLFDNEERAIVGTLYKKSGKESAVLKGLEIVGPKLSSFVKEARKIAPRKKIFIHCWRGGMRSESMAWLFETSGIQSTIITGGYKAYRQHIKAAFAQPALFLILGGMTGSGKTYILKNLKKLGEQIIDLEGLANHKGSAFGGIAQGQQPSTEQFENNLFEEWIKLDLKKPVWLEDESKAIGKVHIPEEIFTKMRKSKVIEVRRSKAKRVEILKKDYAALDPGELKQSVLRISKRLGGQKTKEIVNAIEHKEFGPAIGMVLDYYDKTYTKGLGSREPSTIFPVSLQDNDLEENAKIVQQFVQDKFIVS